MSPTRPCDASLVIQVDDQSRPTRVIVMAGQHMLARITIAEVKRVLEQINELSLRQQIAERPGEGGRSEEEAGHE